MEWYEEIDQVVSKVKLGKYCQNFILSDEIFILSLSDNEVDKQIKMNIAINSQR